MTGRAGPFLLAVDAGTGSCRALLFGPTGEQVAVSLREWAHREPPDAPGGQDFDVEANWAAITACIRDALSAAGATGPTSSHRSTAWACSATGSPTGWPGSR